MEPGTGGKKERADALSHCICTDTNGLCVRQLSQVRAPKGSHGAEAGAARNGGEDRDGAMPPETSESTDADSNKTCCWWIGDRGGRGISGASGLVAPRKQIPAITTRGALCRGRGALMRKTRWKGRKVVPRDDMEGAHTNQRLNT